MDKIKRFNIFINERIEINSIPNNIVLLSRIGKDSVILMLYNIKIKEPIGYIGYGYYGPIGSYTVGGVYSERGYGAFLYESAMTQIYPKALSMSRDGSTSYDALEVWEKFRKRSDVRNERMYSDEITHKKEDLPGGGMYDDNPDEMQRIFDLEDTRFYYTYGIDKLNKLLKIGNEYKIKYKISDLDIEYMQYDLE